MDEPTSRGALSRILHHVDSWASRASLALLVAATALVVGLAFAVGLIPSRYEHTFWTMSAAVTLSMVFVIQHTQTRQQAATQVKLDELVQTIPEADSKVVKVETASDRELHELHDRAVEHRVSAYSDDAN